MFNLGFFGSHNSALAIAKDDIVLEVIELERWISKKNAAFFLYYFVNNPFDILFEIKTYFEKKYGVDQYDNVITNSVLTDAEKIFPSKNYKHVPHHMAHAYSALFQSPYEKSIIISFDGGSDEGFFNVYTANKSSEQILTKIYQGSIDYAVSYMIPAHHINDIKREELHWGNLVYSGKLMGYAGYGKVSHHYLSKIYNLYTTNCNDSINERYMEFLKIFNEYNVNTRVTDEEAKNLAATNQYIFEELFEIETTPIIEQYPELPIIITGGCGLNIINNTRLAKKREVFVPPNPNDCGIALGLVASVTKPKMPIDATYLGSEVWDRWELSKHLYERNAQPLDIQKLAEYITEGNIVGVVRGRAEHGPRALGNRSILCNPAIFNMKDILNAKVKGREYYRPFAPVVRLEDVNKYFEWDKESRWMSFCPKVRDEYKNKLSAIVHIDGTARVQTVTREQNLFLYDLLTRIDKLTGIGVLLNTSFNIAGKPILNTYKEALHVLDTTHLNAVIFENHFIQKEK
jgi:carbamoyltransferase